MKNIINCLGLLTILQLAVMPGAAQVSKGEKFIGSSLTISSDKHDEILGDDTGFEQRTIKKEKEITIIPQFGVGVGRHIVVGGGLGYGVSTAKLLLTSKGPAYSDALWFEAKKNKFAVDLFTGAFLEFNQYSGAFLWLTTRYSWGHVNREDKIRTPYPLPEGKANVYAFNVALRPGVYFKAGKRFIFDVKFGGLSYVNALNDDFSDYVSFDARIEKSGRSKLSYSLADHAELGFRYMLGSSKKK